MSMEYHFLSHRYDSTWKKVHGEKKSIPMERSVTSWMSKFLRFTFTSIFTCVRLSLSSFLHISFRLSDCLSLFVLHFDQAVFHDLLFGFTECRRTCYCLCVFLFICLILFCLFCFCLFVCLFDFVVVVVFFFTDGYFRNFVRYPSCPSVFSVDFRATSSYLI